MTPKLSDDQRQAIEQTGGKPVEVHDERTQKVYVLLTREEFGRLVDDALRRALQVGLEQSDRGESQPWDAEAFLAEARERHASRSV